jgi:putative ABC transport system permease protein
VNLLRTAPGFDPSHVLSLQVWKTGTQFKSGGELANFYESVLQRIEAIAGVESAAVVGAGLPLERGGNVGIKIAGRKDSEWFGSDYREITLEYFRTLGIPLLQGRSFTRADSHDARRVLIINSALARRYFPGHSPIGEHVTFEDAASEIVGVVGDVKSYLNEPAPPTVFIPLAQASYETDQLFLGHTPSCILVRTRQQPLSLSRAVETAVRDADPDLPIGQVRSMEEVLSVSIAFQRFLMTLMSVFASLALVLATIGLYGVISYSVNQRTHEIGLRMALGARGGDVLRLVVGQGLRLTIVGAAVGLAVALVLTRLIQGMLFGVKPTDPSTFVAVFVMLTSVALVACYIPARRATKVDPMVALRYE